MLVLFLFGYNNKKVGDKVLTNLAIGWKDFFEAEQQKPYFKKLLASIKTEYEHYKCYPPAQDIFNLFRILNPSDIKVVIIGQDPYHGSGQANGIAFSVNDNIKNPPSLNNIFKELQNDLNIDHFKSGNLVGWVKQGVFLYNTIGTVRAASPLSHKNLGWLEFSVNLINYLNQVNPDIIYVLWGNYAKEYGAYILRKDHIISGAHPSPFSYHLFRDQKMFLKINDLLLKNKKKIIDWGM